MMVKAYIAKPEQQITLVVVLTKIEAAYLRAYIQNEPAPDGTIQEVFTAIFNAIPASL